MWLRTLGLAVVLSACTDAGSSDIDGGGGRAPSDVGARSTGNAGVGSSSGGSGGSAGGGVIHSVSAEVCFEDIGRWSSNLVEVLRLRSADGGVEVWRARQRTDDPTVGETFAFELVRFWVNSERDPEVCVRDARAMSYEYAHHNWDETWTADTGQTIYEGREVFTPSEASGWQDTLVTTDASGEPLSGRIALQAVGCSSLPYDLNVCLLRPRDDQPPPDWE